MADKDMELDHLFAEARQRRDALPDDLVVRIQTDAEAVRLERLSKLSRPTQGLWSRVTDQLGGWQGLGGLVAASAAGVWIGFSAPAFLPDPASFVGGQDTAYLVSDLGFDTSFLEAAE
ncbi:MAG: hypothetical protein AAFX90_07570 [Pseudomonadota bacterium]